MVIFCITVRNLFAFSSAASLFRVPRDGVVSEQKAFLYIDLLFYHLKLRCYVVIELKACDFEPGFISQLNMYQNVVNDILRHPDDKPTIGLLLVKGKNQTVVEYSLAGYQNPIGVAEWKNQMVQALPEELKSSLPSIEEIEKELE